MRLLLEIVLVILVTICSNQTQARSPNFLLLHLDDVGYGDISFFSGLAIRSGVTSAEKLDETKISVTPSIDRLAGEGIAFTSFYSAACVCSPSRAGILTGRYPIRTSVFPGVYKPEDEKGLPLQETTIAKWLKVKANYRTFSVGKWHLGHVPPFLPPSYGFDKWTGIPYSHDFCPCPSRLTNTLDNQCRDFNPPCPLMNDTVIFQQPAVLETIVDYYVDVLIEWIQDAVRDEVPFFGYYACHHTHHPQFAKKTNIGKSKAMGGRSDPYGDAALEMDEAIGRITRFLRDTSLDSNTYVFLASDNGALLSYDNLSGSNYPLRCGKGTTWEGGQRVPFIVWGADSYRNRVVSDIVAGMDIFPTISKLANIELDEENPTVKLDGLDFSSLISPKYNEKANPRRNHFAFFSFTGSLDAVRVGRYKVHFKTNTWGSVKCHPEHFQVGEQSVPLVYDVESDPGETMPLSRKSKLYQAQVLLARDWLESFDCSSMASIRTSCRAASLPMYCYVPNRRENLIQPFPQTPFKPWSQSRRACCSVDEDIIIPDLTNTLEFQCLKTGNSKFQDCAVGAKSKEFLLLAPCNPGKVLHNACGDRGVCMSVDSNRASCADIRKPHCSDMSGEKRLLKYCPIGMYQCLKTNAHSGDVVCVYNAQECEAGFGGIAYSDRACGVCTLSGSTLTSAYISAKIFEIRFLISATFVFGIAYVLLLFFRSKGAKYNLRKE